MLLATKICEDSAEMVTKALLGFLAVEGKRVPVVLKWTDGIFSDVFSECVKDLINELLRHESLTDNLFCE